MKQLLICVLLLGAIATGCGKDQSIVKSTTPDPNETIAAKPVAEFKILNTVGDGWVLEGSVLEFGNLSKNADSYSWDFGNGTFSKDKTPNDVSFSPCGNTYTITLVAKNKSGDVATYSQTFNVQCSGKHPNSNGG